MRWLALAPMILGGLVALAQVAVTLLVEAEEVRRRRRVASPRRAFRPRVIKGGKAEEDNRALILQ